MRRWDVRYTQSAAKDRDALDASVKHQVDKAVFKVSQNPLPRQEGGYGEPLGNKHGYNLTGLLKIKLKKSGIRVVYRLVRDGDVMRILVIAARADEYVYGIAADRQNETQ